MPGILLAALLVFLLPGTLLLWHIPRCRPSAGRSPAARARAFSVVIPARNEAARIGPLLASLAVQSERPSEIIVVDDESEDATAAVARAAGARVVPARARPEGWHGKSWACWTGARAAATDLLLFLDADTVLEPGGCAALLDERARQGGVITAQPWHRTGSAAERASAFFNVAVMAGFNVFSVLGERLPPSGCFGPCILCTRADYEAAGSHEAVRGFAVEDLALGRAFLRAGVAVHCRGGRGTISFRMYPEGLPGIVRGWTKNMSAGMRGMHPFPLALMVAWITGMVGSVVLGGFVAAAGGTAALGAAVVYLLYAAQVLWMARRTGNFGPITALLYPLGLLFFLAVWIRSLRRAATGKGTSWKGRTVGTT